MCLGIPGQIVELVADNDQLAKVDVAGVQRMINIGLLEQHEAAVGEWVLIHVGFAMARIDEDEARRAFEGLELMGRAYDDELDALRESRVR